MRYFIVFLWFLCFCLSSSHARPLEPVDSAEELEMQLSNALSTKLGIKTFPSAKHNETDDVTIVTQFSADKKNNKPAVAAFIDTRVLGRGKDGKVISQMISITSRAKIALKMDQRLELLEWANAWNQKAYPVRLILTDETLIAASNLVTTVNDPVEEDTFVSTYLSLLQAWPAIIQSLEKNNLLQN